MTFRPHTRRVRLLILIPAAAAAILANSEQSAAAPRKPDRPDEVLETLPNRIGANEESAMGTLRTRLRSNPDDAAAAAELAERHYRIAQRQGDPRHIGYAQAILAPWQESQTVPDGIRLARALIAQFQHDFPAARRDLDAVLVRDPANLAALSYRAVLNIVSADYSSATRDCDALARHGRGLVVEACRPTVDALTGQADRASRQLLSALSRHPAAPANERLWVLTRLGEVAQRLGRAAEAEAHYRSALAIGIVDQYLLATYAEFLIDADRHSEAVTLLLDHAANDILLLRLTVAQQAIGHPDASRNREQMATRFDANRRRSDKTHLADEAWFELRFTGNPQRALALAAENWAAEQREPSDARILLESALAAGNATPAEPVRRWIAQSGIEDRGLRRLAGEVFGQATESPSK